MPRTSDARERIVNTAARLFVERSYHAVGVDELCAAADVRKGSFYHYFVSKSELAKAVIDLHARAFAKRLDRAPTHAGGEAARGPRGDRPIQTGLESQFGRVVGCPFGNLAAELSTTDEDVRAHLASASQHGAGLADVCREAADEGVLRAAPTPTGSPTRCSRSTRG